MRAEELLLRYQDGERNFQGIELRYSDKFRRVDLSRADFSSAHFSNCGLREANFDHAILRNATIDANLRRASFKFADLQGASFCQEFHVASALPKRSSFLGEADFTGANLATADLRAVDCQQAILVSAALVSADLRGADLRNANFQNADLTNANLSDANLCHANFTGANLAGANTTDVKLADTVLPDGSISRYETLSMVEAKVSHFQRSAWKPLVEIRDGDQTASKFGGYPWLGVDEAWPICSHCQEPMQFFFQLNLDQLPAALADKFGKGLLQFFYCTSDADCEGWLTSSDYQLLRIVQPSRTPSTVGIPKIQSDSISKKQESEKQFHSQVIVGWQYMSDYPDWTGEVEVQGVSITYDELFKVATDKILEDSDLIKDLDDWIYMDEREQCSVQDMVVAEFMIDAAMMPFEGDKLAGWPHWVQAVEYPRCPTCDNAMNTLIFELASDDHVPFTWGDLGTGYILQCPEHKEQVACLWQC